MYLLVLSSQLVVGMSLSFTIELFSLQVYALSSKQEQIIIYMCAENRRNDYKFTPLVMPDGKLKRKKIIKEIS
jgi:hypothetical protein